MNILHLATLALVLAVPLSASATDETCETECGNPVNDMWRGLVVADENRCTTYNADDYSYPSTIEGQIVISLGGLFGVYTGDTFEAVTETDIEHIVARSEAHDSGMCARSAVDKRAFASDLLNLVVASPALNRSKSAQDATGWTPDMNKCWFAQRVVEVRRKWGLTIDEAEAEALDDILDGCESTDLRRPSDTGS